MKLNFNFALGSLACGEFTDASLHTYISSSIIIIEGDWLVQRQVLWSILPRLVAKEKDKTERGSWDLGPPEEREEVSSSVIL